MNRLQELIFIALGEASMCWSERPSGVFESDRAVEIGNKLIQDILLALEEPNDKVLHRVS